MNMGQVNELSSVKNSRVVLSGNWARLEDWGIWSAGARATASFDASNLPDRFRIEIELKLFPKHSYQAAQTVRVSSNGVLLMAITNRDPIRKVVFDLRRSPSATKLISLDFDVSNPISPLDLGLDDDLRKLGVGLISLTTKKLPWWDAYFCRLGKKRAIGARQ